MSGFFTKILKSIPSILNAALVNCASRSYLWLFCVSLCQAYLKIHSCDEISHPTSDTIWWVVSCGFSRIGYTRIRECTCCCALICIHDVRNANLAFLRHYIMFFSIKWNCADLALPVIVTGKQSDRIMHMFCGKTGLWYFITFNYKSLLPSTVNAFKYSMYLKRILHLIEE
jgi:hypothetical protein